MAAIAAVIAEVTQQGEDPGHKWRVKPGLGMVTGSPQDEHWAIKPHAPHERAAHPGSE